MLIWRNWQRFVVLIAICVSGCTPLDVTAALGISEMTTGWLDVGLDDLGRNKLVPTISFSLTNRSSQRVRTLQLNGVFRRCAVLYGDEQPDTVSPADAEAGTCAGEVQEWGSALVRAVGRAGVEPGESIGPFTMQSALGYTGEQPRDEILQHREFVDVKVELFVKHRAEQWAKLGEFQIERQLLTQE